MKRPTVLTIAGSDPSGGAGIQADLKTMTAFGCYGMTAITAITVQNTLGVSQVENLPSSLVAAQMDAVFNDIRPDAVKIGMVSCRETIRVIANTLQKHHAENVVLDPVMISTSGHRLMAEDAMEALIYDLLPLADVSTPNFHEGAALSGFPVESKNDMIQTARIIYEKTGHPVLLKGGHLDDSADDLLFINESEIVWYPGKQIRTKNSHGTGCTLSSAIASGLALGFSLSDAVREAKTYLSGALSAGLDLGKGSGPVDHCFAIQGRSFNDESGTN